MKRVVLCDKGESEKTLPICEKYNFGIELQGFYNPNEVKSRKDMMVMYKGIVRAIWRNTFMCRSGIYV